MMNLKQTVKSFINNIGHCYIKLLCKREYKTQQFLGINERPVELRFLFKHLSQKCPKTVLDVGTGITALPHIIRNCGFLVTAIDNRGDYWPFGMNNRHYHVINDDIIDTRLDQVFDFITCVSVLEHIREHRTAVRSMFNLLKPGGHLLLTFPYNESRYSADVYAHPDSIVRQRYPFITQTYSREELNIWIAENNARIVEQEYWQFFSGEYWACGERICPPVQVDKHEKHQISCLLLKKSNDKDCGHHTP